MSSYTIRYSEWIQRGGITYHDLPESLQATMSQFLAAKEAWEKADAATQERLLPILVQADAVIAAAIYRLYPPATEKQKLDKIKLLALRAKALRLKDKE
jgi:hypothetical protein